MAVIHSRYEERASLLAVASITANVRVVRSTGLQLGFGDDENYAGNLVPFSAGTLYEDNPTISYTPVAGEKYARRLLAPLPVTTLAQLSQNLVNPEYNYMMLVSSVNGIRNPDFLYLSEAPDLRFTRFAALMTQLTRAHCLHWVEDLEQGGSFSVVIDNYEPDYVAEVDALLALLGLPAQQEQLQQIVLPVSLALDGRHTGGIGITTRSVFNLVEILSAAIDVPEAEKRDGIAAIYPPSGLVGLQLQVRYAESRPEHAMVAVPHRDGWYYIDEKDGATKRFFKLMATLWSVAIAESSAITSAKPVLTIPVSR